MTLEELVWALARTDEGKRQALFAALSERDRRAVAEAWVPLAGQQEPPCDWRTWLIMAGRGFGKTRTGAE